MVEYNCKGYTVGPGGFTFKFKNKVVNVGEHHCEKDQYFKVKKKFELAFGSDVSKGGSQYEL